MPIFDRDNFYQGFVIEILNENPFFFYFSTQACLLKKILRFINCRYLYFHGNSWEIIFTTGKFKSVNNQNRFVVNVWGGVLGTRLIGAHFLEGNQTAQNYANFIEEDLLNLLDIAGLTQEMKDELWFMQDGHPAHTSNLGIQSVRAIFHQKIIGDRTQFPWPPHSPDLTPCDFFLWGYIKEVFDFLKLIRNKK